MLTPWLPSVLQTLQASSCEQRCSIGTCGLPQVASSEHLSEQAVNLKWTSLNKLGWWYSSWRVVITATDGWTDGRAVGHSHMGHLQVHMP